MQNNKQNPHTHQHVRYNSLWISTTINIIDIIRNKTPSYKIHSMTVTTKSIENTQYDHHYQVYRKYTVGPSPPSL
jgi:hypothetical protein